MQIYVKVLNIFNGAVPEVIILLMMVLSNSVSNKKISNFHYQICCAMNMLDMSNKFTCIHLSLLYIH